jgi:hypothetical protein
VAGGRGGQWRARREREAVEAKKDNDLVRMQQPLEIGGDVVMGDSGDGVGGDTEETRVGVNGSDGMRKKPRNVSHEVVCDLVKRRKHHGGACAAGGGMRDEESRGSRDQARRKLLACMDVGAWGKLFMCQVITCMQDRVSGWSKEAGSPGTQFRVAIGHLVGPMVHGARRMDHRLCMRRVFT